MKKWISILLSMVYVASANADIVGRDKEDRRSIQVSLSRYANGYKDKFYTIEFCQDYVYNKAGGFDEAVNCKVLGGREITEKELRKLANKQYMISYLKWLAGGGAVVGLAIVGIYSTYITAFLLASHVAGAGELIGLLTVGGGLAGVAGGLATAKYIINPKTNSRVGDNLIELTIDDAPVANIAKVAKAFDKVIRSWPTPQTVQK